MCESPSPDITNAIHLYVLFFRVSACISYLSLYSIVSWLSHLSSLKLFLESPIEFYPTCINLSSLAVLLTASFMS
jgi:hypothetical protein